jgi:broad specificity phosphatase PhoE
VRATLDALAARHAGETVVAVTHAGFIVATLVVAFAIPRPGTGAWLDPAHTGLTEWRVREGRWELARYNDTAPLV